MLTFTIAQHAPLRRLCAEQMNDGTAAGLLHKLQRAELKLYRQTLAQAKVSYLGSV